MQQAAVTLAFAGSTLLTSPKQPMHRPTRSCTAAASQRGPFPPELLSCQLILRASMQQDTPQSAPCVQEAKSDDIGGTSTACLVLVLYVQKTEEQAAMLHTDC